MKTLIVSLSLIAVSFLSCKEGSRTDPKIGRDAPSIEAEPGNEESAPYGNRIKPFADFPNTPYINYLGTKKEGC